MTSKEALKRIILGTNVDTHRSSIEEIDKTISLIKKDLEMLECFKKIPKQDLLEFIEWQIRYEKNLNTWLEACNCDLGKEKPTKHLIKIKEWLEN